MDEMLDKKFIPHFFNNKLTSCKAKSSSSFGDVGTCASLCKMLRNQYWISNPFKEEVIFNILGNKCVNKGRKQNHYPFRMNRGKQCCRALQAYWYSWFRTMEVLTFDNLQRCLFFYIGVGGVKSNIYCILEREKRENQMMLILSCLVFIFQWDPFQSFLFEGCLSCLY